MGKHDHRDDSDEQWPGDKLLKADQLGDRRPGKHRRDEEPVDEPE
jgi:hypothetical protein